jgi:hypothetical protein
VRSPNTTRNLLTHLQAVFECVDCSWKFLLKTFPILTRVSRIN